MRGHVFISKYARAWTGQLVLKITEYAEIVSIFGAPHRAFEYL